MENGGGAPPAAVVVVESNKNVEGNPVKQSEPVVMVSEEKPSSDDGVLDNKPNEKAITCTVDDKKEAAPIVEREAMTESDKKFDEAVPTTTTSDDIAEDNRESKEDLSSIKQEKEIVKEEEKEKEVEDEDEANKEGKVKETVKATNGVVVIADDSTVQVAQVKVEQQNSQHKTKEEKPLSPPVIEKMNVETTSTEETKEISDDVSDESDKKNSAVMEVEDQQSSTSSSPSALHIHLDDEDKDETLNDKDKETVDPSLPLISNVVSLSSIASSSSSLTPPPPTRSERSPSTQPPSPTPSAESGNSNSVRRTTLRFKRGIEISFDVDQNGQPVTVNNHDNSSAMPSASSGEPRQKRGRMDEDEDEESQPDLLELDAEGTSTVLLAVQKDIRTLRFMAKQKEKEWNYILKLMKVKEELQAKLMRRKEVLKITSTSTSRKNVIPNTPQTHTVAQTQMQQQSGSANLQTLINHSLNAMMSKSSSSSKNAISNNPAVSIQHSQHLVQQQQQQQQLQQFQQQQHLQQQAKMNRQRPILPKPSMQIHPEVQMWNQQHQQQQQQHQQHQQQQQHHHHHHHNNNNNNNNTSNSNNNSHHHHHHVVDSVLGASADSQADARNRQGTISVQSLIADYRAKHPEEIPTRGRRIRQPSRICNDPNSSSSPPPNSQSIGPEAGSMSFKDVLLQFAKMSSRQGHPNPVDMIQVGKESPGPSGNSAIAGSSGNSSAAALQSLAAARNARSSPHTTALSAGSILQSALSGSRTNPNFAPTLAQLLTNPANEQQQQGQPQQQQQHPQQSPMVNCQPVASIPVATVAPSSSSAAVAAAAVAAAAAAAASSAEVLTLSNLLATARGHVTITSERGEPANDDVTVVGGSTSGRNASSNNGNYMRTSGGGEVPKCQGCNERVAQFVCAGCSSQWYCSRECQVAAWEEHSEHCVG